VGVLNAIPTPLRRKPAATLPQWPEWDIEHGSSYSVLYRRLMLLPHQIEGRLKELLATVAPQK
jgi:hypothetical protein